MDAVMEPGTNEQLLAALRAGDKSARDALILGNMGLVRMAAHKLSNGNPELRDCLVSAGNLCLVEAVDSLARRTTPLRRSVATYLQSAIKYKLYAECEEVHPIGAALDHVSVVYRSDATTIAVWDELKACIQTDEERTVIRMAYAGHKNTEIADVLHISEATVCRRLKCLHARYLRRKGLSLGNIAAQLNISVNEAARFTRLGRTRSNANHGWLSRGGVQTGWCVECKARLIRFTNTDLCEDCWADDAHRCKRAA